MLRSLARALTIPVMAITPCTAGAQAISTSGDNPINFAIAQGQTTTGQGGSLILGGATTSPPSFTTGQSDPFNLDLNGGLRVGNVCNGVINVAQSGSTDVHTFTGFGYICSIILVTSNAQNIGIDEGTGTTCATSGTALIGVSSTVSGTAQMAFAANGGLTIGNGMPFLKMQKSADHLCVLQSSTGEVAGVITYGDLTN